MAKTKQTIDWKDVGTRAIKTFAQSFAAVVLATDQPMSKQVLIAGLAAGISAAWNLIKEVI